LPRNDLVLRAARRERTERTPVWLMRQAGRCDPEYRRFRERHPQPLEVLFSTPELAVEASLLPRRLGVDALIFYQDILTLLGPLGAEFVFRPEPTTAQPVRASADVARLRRYDVAERLPFVGQTLRQVKAALNDELPLLGFAGAPLTLLFFLAAGRSPTRGAAAPQALLRDDPATAHRLLALLADQTAEYLAYQIASGADAVQLFESCADLVDAPQYRTFALPYQARIFEQLGPRVPRILFAKEQPDVAVLAESGADVLSVGRCVDLAAARRQWGERVAFQGNVDNELLVRGTPAEVEAATRACIAAGEHSGHILNLSHGLLRETPIENVCALIDTCRRTMLSGARAAG
jgi:uroporphyrinogen decarboxylase